jgi:hypothetical protein
LALSFVDGDCKRQSFWELQSVGIIGMRGMRTSSPLKGPVKTVASTTLLINEGKQLKKRNEKQWKKKK